MPVERLRRFLEENHVKFVVISHSRAYTAHEIAASAHIPGKELAKTVMVKVDGELAMVVLPGPDKVSIRRLQQVAGSEDVRLATESEFASVFPSCELGAMPPFGNLWGLDVYVDERLAEDEHIAFNAGSHTELVRLPYAEFERLVEPRVANLHV